MRQILPIGLLVIFVGVGLTDFARGADRAPQYKHGDILVPGASAKEAKLKSVSVEKAEAYLEQGALAWSRQRKCVACHTTGSYLRIRPSLTKALGQPKEEVRKLFETTLAGFQQQQKKDAKKLLEGIKPTQIAYVAAGLAEWDAHVGGGKLSDPTKQALELMFSVQAENGSWGNTDCWPPFESSAYQGATVAAMAAATAPGWLESVTDEKLKAKIEKLKKYLRTTKPPHEYARVLLLWAATRLPDLLDDAKKQEVIKLLRDKGQKDGGWSIRTFAKPEQWGNGRRAKKLKAEPQFKKPESDGHMTGLAVLVLRDAGVPAEDETVQAGVKWLLANQRESGRWWTRSLNTDSYHFITFSGTAYSLAALDKCNALPK